MLSVCIVQVGFTSCLFNDFWLLIIVLQFHTSILQVSIPSLLPASKGLETSEKAKLLPKPETPFEEKYVLYDLTLQCKCSEKQSHQKQGFTVYIYRHNLLPGKAIMLKAIILFITSGKIKLWSYQKKWYFSVIVSIRKTLEHVYLSEL